VSGYYDRSGRYHRPGSSSRSGGWWTYAAPRPSNGIGIGLEIPSGRACAWNVALLAWGVVGTFVARHLGATWAELALGAAGVVVIGGAVLAYGIGVATPRAARRHRALLRAHSVTGQEQAVKATPAGGVPAAVRVPERVGHAA
jgi:hypothetical protein